jgi:predicted nuclease with TOPRIM domain
MMNEESENTVAILQRLEKIEALLERIDRESRNEEARKAAFDVRWDQLMKEHLKMQEHVKENWERLNLLEQEPIRKKARMWDTVTGRAIILIGTAIATAVLTHIPAILKILLEAK